MNYGVILHTLGYVLCCEAACMLLPLICSAVYNEEALYSFLISIALCVIFGVLLLVKKPKAKEMYAKEGFVIAALSWIVISVFGAIPFVISGSIPSFIDALFETASGFSTTGASILSDVEVLPKSMLMWRSFSHWIGGMGVLVFLVAFLQLSGGSNLFMLKAESPGPAVGKLVPKIRSSAKINYGIYFGMTIILMLVLFLSGMPLFDTLTLSFGTAGTGGFAIKNSGLADYTSFQQITITIFMLLFGIDFTFYYLLLTKKIKTAFKMEEVKKYLLIVFLAITLISINCIGLYGNLFENIKHAAFQVASIITTTGYSTVDFNLWPQFSKTILVILMFIGACAGSTGGGIKVSRIVILIKSVFKEIKVAAQPKRTHKISFNQKSVDEQMVKSICVYLAAYVVIFFASLLIISFDNFDFTTNFTAVLATLNNIGPGLAKVGPIENFSIFSPLSKIVLTFDMLIGRLELFPFLILFSRNTWRK